MTQMSFALTPSAPRRRGGVQRTSCEAAQQMKAHLDRRVSRAVAFLRSYPGELPTSGEIARWAGKPVLELRIGLSDAKRAGWVENGPTRRCAVSGRTCLTWRVRTR